MQGAGWANLARSSDVPLSAAAVERIVSRSDALLQIATAAGKDTAPLEERFAVLQRFLDEGGTTLQDLLRFSQEVE